MATLAELWDSNQSTKDFTQFPQSRGVTDTHKGIDYKTPLNTPIAANISGTIRYKTNDPKGYGNAVEIVDEKGNVLQRYAHLNEFSVPNGSKIEAGQILGKSGNTGRSTGPHLHFEDFQSKYANKQTGETLADLWDKTPATEQPKVTNEPKTIKPSMSKIEAIQNMGQKAIGEVTGFTPETAEFVAKDLAAKFDNTVGSVLPFFTKKISQASTRFLGADKAAEISDKLTSYVDKPVGKAFGITNDPVYQNEALGKIMNFIGENKEKGDQWIANKTGINKNDVAFFSDLALIKAGEVGAKATGKAAKQISQQFEEAKKEFPVAEMNNPVTKPTVTLEPLEQKSTLSGAGAAEVGQENLRIARAKELPIPIELSKDQATRSPADVRFARETAKDPVLGQPLQEKYASDNAKIQQNLNQFIQDTGAEFSEAGTPKLGEMLVNTVEPYKNTRKAEIEPAYTQAKEAGHMSEPLEINPLQKFVEKNASASKNAPIINAIENEISRLSKDGKITINDLEEVRKMVNVLRQDAGPNSYYGKNAIRIIDKMTENKGGELYQKARKLNADYMTEFEDTPVLKNIFSTKRGTTQRAIAIEDLVEKSLLKGPKDDVVKLFSTLEKSGPEGATMINELRGYVAQKIKDEATKGVSLDINGLPYVSTKNLDTIIKNLDKSGKLEYIFGKKGAEHYRTLNDVTKDLQTIPQNVTNPSGTAATLLGALTEMGVQGATTGIPIPIAMIGKQIYKNQKTKSQLKKISDFVNYSKENK